MEYVNFSEKKTFNLNSEKDLQESIVKFLRDTDLLFCSTLGGCLDTAEKRVDAYKSGYQKGTPDLIIYTPMCKYNGLAIELKNPWGTGKLSKEQAEWINKLSVESNYFCIASNDYTEIIEILVKYVNGIL